MFEQQQPPSYQQGGYQHPGYDPDYRRLAASLKGPSKAPWVMMMLMMLAAGAGGYWLYNDREAARAEAREAATAAEGTKKTLEDRLKALEAEKAELVTARDSLQKTLEAKSTELAELKGTYDKLHDKMKDEIDRGDIALTQSDGRLRVDMVDKILFDSGDAKISKRGESVLARLGTVLATIDDKQIQVSGHTDNNPISSKLQKEFPSNWELSVARATNVVRFLEEQAKVPATHLVASGYGPNQPIASNHTAQGRARNRRIEILLTPGLAPKKMSASKLKEAEAEAKAEAKTETKAAKADAKPAKHVASASRKRR